MRKFIVLMAATALSACGGSSPNSAGTVAVGTGGTTGGTTTGATATAQTYAEFKTPTVSRTYAAVGGSQVFEYLTDTRFCCGQQAQRFAGRSSTVRNSVASITYDPAAAVFTLTVADPLTGASTATRYQDPANRTNFGGAIEPQWGVPNLANTNIRYLQAGDGNPLSPFRYSGSGAISPGTNVIPPDGTAGSTYQSTNFFYELPGTRTNFVTFAGYLRNSLNWSEESLDLDNNPTTPAFLVHKANWHLERGAFAYGITTDPNAVPKTGSGTYTGGFLATMVYNPTMDGAFAGGVYPTYFQWIEGSATTNVNFATNAVTLGLTGTVSAPSIEYYTFVDPAGVTRVAYTDPRAVSVAAGSTFTAAGTATINLVTTGGFTGSFQSAGFSATTNGSPTAVNIAGSTIDGAFFGPAAEEVGGGIHIAGATPDQRVDIVGAFTGKKP